MSEKEKERIIRAAEIITSPKRRELEKAVGSSLCISSMQPTLKRAIRKGLDYLAAGYEVKLMRRTHPASVERGRTWEVRATPPGYPREVTGTYLEDILRGEKVPVTSEWETFYHLSKLPKPREFEEEKELTGEWAFPDSYEKKEE